MRENHPTRERRDAAGTSSVVPHFALSPPRLAFLAWGDFHAYSRFKRSNAQTLLNSPPVIVPLKEQDFNASVQYSMSEDN